MCRSVQLAGLLSGALSELRGGAEMELQSTVLCYMETLALYYATWRHFESDLEVSSRIISFSGWDASKQSQGITQN